MIEVSRILVSEKLENRALRHKRSEGSAPVVVWCTTKRCNLNCMHCYSGGNTASEGELSTDEAKRMLDELKDYGSPFMILSGGEPFLREDVFELGQICQGDRFDGHSLFQRYYSYSGDSGKGSRGRLRIRWCQPGWPGRDEQLLQGKWECLQQCSSGNAEPPRRRDKDRAAVYL